LFETFEHTADIGVRGIGKTVEEAFTECAKAMFSIMFDLENITPCKEIKITCESTDLESLLVSFLNELLTEMDLEGIVFKDFKVTINDNKLTAIALGEEFNPEKHHPKTEVKAATYSQVKVEKTNDHWIAQCIVDV